MSYNPPMSRFHGEKVLVVPRLSLEQVGYFQGVHSNGEAYLNAFMAPGVSSFMDREEAEKDPSHKQIIPYGIFCYQGKILHYTRGGAGGEARLHDKGSLGIGGHINPIDWQGADHGLATYMAGVEREVQEELNFGCAYTQRVIGVINDDSNEVGAVHLGLVHLFELDGDAVSSNEDAIANIRFFSPEELREAPLFSKLETWSQLSLDLLSQQSK